MTSIWELANPQLRDLAVYEPGKPIEETARELGVDPNAIIKLASNENPLGPSPKAIQAMHSAAENAHLYPDGGGVYSAAKSQGRLLAVVGALLLVADLTVTAALSGWSALTYVISGAEHIIWLKFLKDHIAFTTIAVLLFLGFIN